MKPSRRITDASSANRSKKRCRACHRRAGLRFETLEPRTMLTAAGLLAEDSQRFLGDPLDAWERAAMTSNFDPWTPYGPQPTSSGSQTAEGEQSVLFIRVRFLDRDFSPSSDYSDAVVRQRLAAIDDFYRSNSFGLVSYPDHLLDIVPDVVTIPRTVAELNQFPDPSGVIHSEARDLAQALGFDLSLYDSIVVLFPEMHDGGKITYGGLATIGGSKVWLHNTLSAAIWGHELGHNLGAGHSRFWKPADPFEVLGTPPAGSSYEYGNHLDLMGSGSLDSGHFSAYWKTRLGWLTEPVQVPTVVISGIFDLFALDEGFAEADRVYALRVPRVDGQQYWLEHRANSGSESMDNGLIFNWHDGTQTGEPALIDLTPGSRPGDDREDRLDAALPLGRTYSDWSAALHVTAVSRDATPGSDYVQVIVQHGEFSDNLPPWATLTADRTAADIGQTVHFTATADSRDGDTPIVFWDFGDGTTQSGSLTAQHQWSVAGEYPVRLAVSDTKGGLAERIVLVNVGPRSILSVHQSDRDMTVNTDTAGDQKNPAAASDGGDRLVIVWESTTPDGEPAGIFAQRMRGDGTRVGEPLLVSNATADSAENPDVAMAANGDFVVVWQGRESGSTDSDEIYAQRFVWDGGALGPWFQVNTDTFANQEKPTVAIEPTRGEFVVAWSSSVWDRNVSFRRYAADGTPRDAEERAAPGGRHFSHVDVAMFPDSGFVLVWDNDSGEEGGPDTSGRGVYAQIYESDGTPAAGPLPVNSTTAGEQYRPRVAADDQGDFSVVWVSKDQDGEGSGVFLRSFQRDGAPLGNEMLVNETTAKDQSAPALTIDHQRRRIVSWRDGWENTIGPADGNNAHRILDRFGAPLTPEYRTTQVRTDFFSGPDVAVLAADPATLVIVNPERLDAVGVDVRARFFALAEPLDVGPDELSIESGANVDIDATANDHSPNGGPLRLSLHGRPSAGSVELLPADPLDSHGNDHIRYTPAPGFRGTDSFSYQVTDAAGATALGVITVHVGIQTLNSPPTAVDDFLSTVEGQLLLIGDLQLLANDHDPDGDWLSVVDLFAPDHGTVQDLGHGVWSYLSPAGFTGQDQLTYRIDDGRGGTDTATVHIRVTTAEPDLRPRDLLVYRGSPGSINDAADLESAAVEFAAYDLVLLGEGPQDQHHPYRTDTLAIIQHPATENTSFFGYVDLGVHTQNLPMETVCGQLEQWQSLGVTGVLLDGFGYESGTSRMRQNEAAICAHRRGLRVIANGSQGSEVFGDHGDATYNPAGLPSRLTAADYYLDEGYQIADGGDVSAAQWRAKAADLETYRTAVGFGVLAVTTHDLQGVFDPQRFAYAWYSAVLDGYSAVGWGEAGYAADTAMAPWRQRPEVQPGTQFVGDLRSAEPRYWRHTDQGVVHVDTLTGQAGFSPNFPGFPWRNPRSPEDVDDSGLVTPLDVLTLINEINRNGPRTLSAPDANKSPPPYWDVNGDNQLTAADVLVVINYLNRRP